MKTLIIAIALLAGTTAHAYIQYAGAVEMKDALWTKEKTHVFRTYDYENMNVCYTTITDDQSSSISCLPLKTN